MKWFSQSKWLSLVVIFVLASQAIFTGSAFAANDISKLVLNKNELNLQVGDTANLTATAVFTSGSTENATVKTDWNSGTTDVATVYAGVVTAKKEGKAVITATYLGETVIVNVTVTKKVKSLTTDKQAIDLRLNGTSQVLITAYYDDGTSADVTSKADYTVASSSVATVTNGLVKGQNPGSTTITVTHMNQSIVLDVDVEVVRRLDAEKSNVSLLLKGTSVLELTATYPDGTKDNVAAKAVWTSDKPEVADALKGTITGYSVGKATLTATYGTKSTTITVDVDSTVKLELDKQSILLKKNGTGTLKLNATYPTSTTPTDISERAEWTSSDESIVSVTKGKLIGNAIGEATISAKYGDKTVTAKVDVEVPRRLVVSSELVVLKTDETQQVELFATYADGTTDNLVKDRAVWSVDNEEIATVTNGLIKPYKAGVANVTATYGGKTTTTRVEVDIPNTITLDKKTVNMQVGDSTTVTVTANFKGRTDDDLNDKTKWTSSNQDVVEVRDGIITGIANGAATVTAEYGTRKATVQVSVGELKTLTINQEKLTMKKAETATLTAEAMYTDDTKKTVTADVIWTSSNVKAATVDKGVVKAIASGETTITAQLDNKTVTIPVKVDMANELKSNVASLVFDLNETRLIKITATDDDGEDVLVTTDVEWKSSNTSIATVSKGLVTPVARGKATITATYGGKSVSVPVEIGVIDSLTANKSFFVTKSGSETQLKLTATLSDGSTKDVTDSATWKVSSYKLGTVEKGLFTATASGKTTITGSFGGKTVSIPVEIDTLKYLKTNIVKLTLKEGETAKVEAIATYSDGSEDDVTKPALWTTSNIMNADVKDGVIKATGKGTARISITYGNMRTTVQVTITK
ncbi:Ig-like domain-containing protein [Paenibacillus qinlingensis]|uniref:Ig-like domain-containing protein n=1 Tax=Paenibacillus qinlingensis TaxID=1837343 RepID=UPI001567A567|nr:Ig-like domain-containing protein [Paenibacillus qinlingensis]NQX63883.1 Ig-like domain-containing protein [Paenibacillus qinlingensis]